MPDNAVLDAPSPVEPQEATPEEILTEPAPEDSTAPEAIEEPTEPEGEDSEPDPYEGLTPKEIADKLRADIRKDERARADESLRQRLDAKAQEETDKAKAAVFAANKQRATAARQGWAYQQLSGITKQAFDQGRDAPDQRAIAAVSQDITLAAHHDAHEELMGHLWAGVLKINPDYAVSPDLSRRMASASADYNLAALAELQLEAMGEAIDQVRGKQAAARAEAETAAKNATKAVTAKPRATGPTAIQGGSGRGGVPTTIREADAAVGAATTAEARREALAVAKALRARGAPW